MRLRGWTTDLGRRRGALGRLPAGREPMKSENEEPRDVLGGSARPPGHRGVIAARLEGCSTQRQSKRQMLDDLRWGPFADRATFPVGIAAMLQWTQHQRPQLAEPLVWRAHHRVRARQPVVSIRPDMRGICE